MRRPRLQVFGLFLLLGILYNWKILFGHQFSLITGFEGANQAYSWYSFLARTLHSHSSILWDPFSFSGHPFLEEMQNGALYPVNLAVAALVPLKNGVFSLSAYNWLHVLTHVAGAFFMFLLVTDLGIGTFGAIVAGLGFAFGGVMARFGGWPHMLQSFIWFPLVFLFVKRAIEAARGYTAAMNAALAGACIALSILAGGLYPAIMQAVLVVAMSAFGAFQLSKGENFESAKAIWVRCAGVVVIAGFVAAAGGAAQLFPAVAGGAHNLRTVGSALVAQDHKTAYHQINRGIWPHGVISLFFAPMAFNGNIGPGEAALPYMGVVGAALSIIAIWKCWASIWVRFCAWLIAAAVTYSVAEFSILHGVLYAAVPRIWMAREASRALYLADLSLAILIAFGADRLFRSHAESWDPLWRVLKWVSIGCGVALVIAAVYPHTEVSPWVDFSLILFLATAGLLWRITQGPKDWTVRFLVIFLLLFDLYAFDWSALNVAVEQSKHSDQLERLYSFRGATEFLKSKPGVFRVEVLTDPVSNIGDSFGVQTTWGAAATVVKLYDRYRDKREIWNIRYSIKPASTSDAGAVYADQDWKIYENPQAGPRAWLVHNVKVFQSEVTADIELRNPAFNPLDTAIAYAPLSRPLTLANRDEHVEIRKYDPASVTLAVHAGGAALLVLSELYYPGWIAYVNGNRAPVMRVDGALRGIEIGTGDSVVQLRYRPIPVLAGIVTSLATFSGLAAFVFVAWNSRRARRTPID